MWLLSVLIFTHIVIIDRCIHSSGRGRINVDVIHGYDKSYLRQKMFMIGTEESNNDIMMMNAA